MSLSSGDLFVEVDPTERRQWQALDQFFQQNFAGAALLDPQDLVDVAAGQATASQRLRVAAYLRTDTHTRRQLAALQKEWTALQGNTPGDWRTALQRRLPQFVATPLAAAVGLRSLAETSWQQTFQVIELQAQVTVRIVPPSQERWQIEGYVTQNHLPVPNAKVTLHSQTARPRPRQTDAAGFFAFRRLPAGEVSLRVYLEQGILRIDKVRLQE